MLDYIITTILCSVIFAGWSVTLLTSFIPILYITEWDLSGWFVIKRNDYGERLWENDYEERLWENDYGERLWENDYGERLWENDYGERL